MRNKYLGLGLAAVLGSAFLLSSESAEARGRFCRQRVSVATADCCDNQATDVSGLRARIVEEPVLRTYRPTSHYPLCLDENASYSITINNNDYCRIVNQHKVLPGEFEVQLIKNNEPGNYRTIDLNQFLDIKNNYDVKVLDSSNNIRDLDFIKPGDKELIFYWPEVKLPPRTRIVYENP